MFRIWVDEIISGLTDSPLNNSSQTKNPYVKTGQFSFSGSKLSDQLYSSVLTDLKTDHPPEVEPEKTADISRRHQQFHREIMFGEQAQKFHTVHSTLPRCG